VTSPYLKINPIDNVAVLLADVGSGTTLNGIVTREEIRRGHKVALQEIPQGAPVVKYGSVIGKASETIQPGSWVHSQNLVTALDGVLEYEYVPELPPVNSSAPETFEGYVRENGEVGIRNEIWIIPGVGCVNQSAESIIREATRRFDLSGIDGVHSFSHPYGCSQLGGDHEVTQQTLAALVNHPNAAAVLVLGLGCENNTPDSFREAIGPQAEGRVKFLVSQEVEDEVEEGVNLLEDLLTYARQFRRQPVPVSKLKVGLKCGGSDGFSGITANPVVGAFSDMLVDRGGITALTEVPEMFGAETLLMNRCASKEIFDKCVSMINGFKEYFMRYDQPVYENPSPGNKDGGITTLEEKSLGCTQKGGTSRVVDVRNIGEKLSVSGLNLVNGPGNDIVAVTTLAAAGAHLVLFTTGRGTPLGGPVPTVKIATNTPLADKKSRWIDFDTGPVVEGLPVEESARKLFDYVLELASGEVLTRNEENDAREIAIFKDGVTL